MAEIGEGIRHPIKAIKTGIETFRNWRQQRAEISTQAAQAREAMRREEFIRDKDEVGCVMRSLESALGVQATDQEWQMRIEDIKRMKQQGGMDPQFEFIEYVREYHRTPLGEALQRFDVQRVNTGREVREALEQQKVVLMTMHVILPDGRSGFHMAHVETGAQSGQIVLKSDPYKGGQKLMSDDLRDDGYHPSLVFTPKPIPPTTPQ